MLTLTMSDVVSSDSCMRLPDPCVLVMIPAHNEEDVIAQTLSSLRTQTRPADHIVVVADNCTDATEEIARNMGVDVFRTSENIHKKGGALNQALERYLPQFKDGDCVLIMDADTDLLPRFIEIGVDHVAPDIGGVGGIFTGRESHTMLGTLQRMEYFRYGRDLHRNGDRPFVLTGTGTLFRVGALRAVRDARNGDRLPEGDGYYDTHSLTEDNELTLALLSLGYRAISPPGMLSCTDVMESTDGQNGKLKNFRLGLQKLKGQRDRWYLGALRNLHAYGAKLPSWMRWIYWRQQIGLAINAFGILLYLLALTVTVSLELLAHGGLIDAPTGMLAFSPWWSLIIVLFVIERTVTVWKMGWKARLIAVAVVFDMAYSLYLQRIYFSAVVSFLRGKKGEWKPT